jgi:hypothetical protein
MPTKPCGRAASLFSGSACRTRCLLRVLVLAGISLAHPHRSSQRISWNNCSAGYFLAGPTYAATHRFPGPVPGVIRTTRPHPAHPCPGSDSESPPPARYTLASVPAALAQSAERLTRNEKVIGSIPIGGSTRTPRSEASFLARGFRHSGLKLPPCPRGAPDPKLWMSGHTRRDGRLSLHRRRKSCLNVARLPGSDVVGMSLALSALRSIASVLGSGMSSRTSCAQRQAAAILAAHASASSRVATSTTENPPTTSLVSGYGRPPRPPRARPRPRRANPRRGCGPSRRH